MLILAKSMLGLMIGFLVSIVFGAMIIPILRKLKFKQTISSFTAFRHASKNGVPTVGGLIFIIPTLLVMFLLHLRGSIHISHSILIITFVFISYALLGLADDLLKIRYKNNDGLSVNQKLLAQVLIALIFFYIYMKNGGDAYVTISSLNLSVNLKWGYGLFILFLLVGSSNAVNLTDGLDGLSGTLSFIAFIAFGIITWGTTWIEGYQEIAIFCFVLSGCLLGYLVFNVHPAKVIMGDTGSLALGATLSAIAILTKHELSLAVIGGVFVVEALSAIIQIISITKFKKKVFLMAPLHHHFEKLGWEETDIVKLFVVVGFFLATIAVYYGVWM